VLGSIIGIIAWLFFMGTNKERIEQLEVRLDEVQNGLHGMELGMTDKPQHLEKTHNHLSDVLLAD